MNKGEVRELLRKRGAGKIDSYLHLTARKRQSQSDLSNLLQIWVHCILYSRRIYPLESFQQREVLGIQVQTASSPPLKQYLDDFFNKLKPHLGHVNHLKVMILGSRGQVEETNILFIEDLSSLFEEEGSEPREKNPLQRQMQIKAFLFDLQKHIQSSGSVMELEGERTFKLRVGYRHQTNEKETRELLAGWVVRQKQEEKGQIACSLKSSTLNLIYEIVR